jgi:hypothetical protein
MNERDIKAKKAAIRREIKQRMQAELDERKKEIRKRIKRENISVEEKRRKYRQETHEEKLRLMESAKEEFRARKRMLGLSDEPEQAVYSSEEDASSSPHIGVHEGEEMLEDVESSEGFPIAEEENDSLKTPQYSSPDNAFVYSDSEEDDVLHHYAGPISESDIAPFGAHEEAVQPPAPEILPEAEETSSRSIFYYIINLIVHPVQTLDEFDEYLESPLNLVKVGLFYLISLLPVVLFSMFGEGTGTYMPGGLIGTAVSSTLSQQPNALLIIGQPIMNLLVFSFSIAVVNYLVTNKANFFTLVLYFGFVEAVTRIATYTLILMAVFGVLTIAAQPQLTGIIAGLAVLLLLAFIIWTFALNMIVLMSAYGYDLAIAFVLSFVANIVKSIIFHIAARQLGFYGF